MATTTVQLLLTTSRQLPDITTSNSTRLIQEKPSSTTEVSASTTEVLASTKEVSASTTEISVSGKEEDYNGDESSGVNQGLIMYDEDFEHETEPLQYTKLPDFWFDQRNDSETNLTNTTLNTEKGRVFGNKRFADPAYINAIPVVLGICLMATILFAGILCTRLRQGSNMTRASCGLLLFVAAADAMTMISAVSEVTFMYSQSLGNNMLLPYSSCQIMLILERLSAVPHAASTWFTVLLGIQRYICVSFPFVAGKYITVRRSTVCVLIVCLASIGMHLCKFLDTTFVEVLVEYASIPGQTIETCRAKYRPWVRDKILYESVFAWTRILTMQILPCILMMTFGLLLLQSLRKQNLATENNQLTVTKQQAARRRLSRFVIIVSSIVFCVELSNAIFLSFNAWEISTGTSVLSYESLKAASLGFDLALYLSYFLIFILYCAMSGKFRETLTSFVRLQCFVREKSEINYITISGKLIGVPQEKTGRTSVSIPISVVHVN